MENKKDDGVMWKENENLGIIIVIITLIVFVILIGLAGYGYFGQVVEDFVRDWAVVLWQFRLVLYN